VAESGCGLDLTQTIVVTSDDRNSVEVIVISGSRTTAANVSNSSGALRERSAPTGGDYHITPARGPDRAQAKHPLSGFTSRGNLPTHEARPKQEPSPYHDSMRPPSSRLPANVGSAPRTMFRVINFINSQFLKNRRRGHLAWRRRCVRTGLLKTAGTAHEKRCLNWWVCRWRVHGRATGIAPGFRAGTT
jgi:hypothetical protein